MPIFVKQDMDTGYKYNIIAPSVVFPLSHLPLFPGVLKSAEIYFDGGKLLPVIRQ